MALIRLISTVTVTAMGLTCIINWCICETRQGLMRTNRVCKDARGHRNIRVQGVGHYGSAVVKDSR